MCFKNQWLKYSSHADGKDVRINRQFSFYFSRLENIYCEPDRETNDECDNLLQYETGD